VPVKTASKTARKSTRSAEAKSDKTPASPSDSAQHPLAANAPAHKVPRERSLRSRLRRSSDAYFRLLTENSLDIISILEPDGTIRYESLRSCASSAIIGRTRRTLRFEFFILTTWLM